MLCLRENRSSEREMCGKMDKKPWTEGENQKTNKGESLGRYEDEQLEGEKEENLQVDRERAENRKTVRMVFGRVALGFSVMIIAASILVGSLVPILLDSIPGGENNFNVAFLLSSLILYSVGIITYLVLERWVPNLSTHEVKLSQSNSFDNKMQPDMGIYHRPGLSRPRRLTSETGSMLVVICLALGFISNLITMGINYGINFFNHTRELREITQQYLEAGYGVIPEAPYFLEVDPLLEMVGGLNPILSFFLIVVTTSIFEEMIFRKLLYDKLIVFGGKIYIFVSSLFFALFHLNHHQLIYTFAVGLVFAGVMYYTQKVSYCIWLHMCFNFFGTLALHVQELPEMVVGGYGMIFLGLVVTGIVFLVRKLVTFKEWATFEPAQLEVKKRKDIFLNLGMIIFFILTVVGMIENAMSF